MQPGKIAQQGADLASTEAGTAGKRADTAATEGEEGRAGDLHPGNKAQQAADLAETGASTAQKKGGESRAADVHNLDKANLSARNAKLTGENAQIVTSTMREIWAHGGDTGERALTEDERLGRMRIEREIDNMDKQIERNTAEAGLAAAKVPYYQALGTEALAKAEYMRGKEARDRAGKLSKAEQFYRTHQHEWSGGQQPSQETVREMLNISQSVMRGNESTTGHLGAAPGGYAQVLQKLGINLRQYLSDTVYQDHINALVEQMPSSAAAGDRIGNGLVGAPTG